MTFKITTIKATGEVKTWARASAPGLKMLQDAVGGYVELIPTTDGSQFYVNEDGLSKRLPINAVASIAASRPIVGDVIIVHDETPPHDQEEGDDDDRDPNEPPKTPNAYTVAVYLCDREFGGPEEGGWYYDSGRLSVDHWFATKVFPTRAEANVYRDQLQIDLDTGDNAGRPKTSSVLSIGRFMAEVYDSIPPAHYPATRPFYS